jgi:hypothetical protein
MVGFPLLLIPLAIYNIIVYLMPGVSLTEPVVKLPMMSGAEWPLTLSDMLLALGIILLLCEVIKGARPGAKYLTDHLLSLIIFGGAAAEFLLLPRFASSTFFLLTLLTLADFLSGISLRARRGTAKGAAAAPQSVRRPAPVAVAPRPEPQAVDREPPPPAAASPAAATPPEHSGTTPVHSETETESEISSPDLQPTDGMQRPPGTTPQQH